MTKSPLAFCLELFSWVKTKEEGEGVEGGDGLGSHERLDGGQQQRNRQVIFLEYTLGTPLPLKI